MGALAWIADRLQLAQDEGFLGKAFPAEDSFLLGEIALFTFAILGATGIFLGAFYEPSTTEVVYEGSVAKFQGDTMPAAYVSVLHLTYDVPYGMFLRRMHHWAAHLFVASIGLHMLRVFFTGAYRNPREPNWLIGSVLAILAMLASYTGYSLPFDEFATTATGIGYNVAKSVPLIGDFLSELVFAGEFPSSATIPRLYFIHVVIVPAVIAGLIALHMFILIRQKHTEGRRSQEKADLAGVEADDDSIIVGLPAVPNQAGISLMVFFLTAATLSILAGFFPAHNVAEYGPSNPAATPALVMPDWFLMWLYGFLKLIPASLGFSVAGVHISTEFLGGVVLPGVLFLGIFAWPFIDSADEPEHFSYHPMDRPFPTAVGVGAIVLVMAASLAGMNNIVATILGTTTGVITPALAVLVVAGPVVAAGITYVLARGAGGGRDE